MTFDSESSNEYRAIAVPRPELQPWSVGPAVVELQELLNGHGFKLRVDGDFGCQTEAAVRAFQRQNNLRSNSIVDMATWNALQANIQPGARALQQGRSGSDVWELQGLLKINGYPIQRDGWFGEETHRAVTAFQQRHNLLADGIVGPITWRLLRGSPLPTPPEQKHWFYHPRRWW